MSDLPAAPSIPRLWTAWCTYGATGEGETLMALIAYAESPQEIESKFHEVFDPFFGCTCELGVQRNAVTTCLFAEKTLEYVQGLDGVASVSMHGQLHFNLA